MRGRGAQDYSPAEFDAVVALITADAGLQADIEAITGQSLHGKTPRELFNLFRTIHQATQVSTAVADYGRARTALQAVRTDLEQTATAEQALTTARSEIIRLEQANGQLKRKNADLLRALPGHGNHLAVASGQR